MAYPYLQDLLREVFGLNVWLPIPSFGFMAGCSAIACYGLFDLEVRRLEKIGRLPTKSTRPKFKPLSQLITDFALWTMNSGVIGARIFAVLENVPAFLRDPVGMLLFRGGFAILGGLIFATAAGVIFVRRKGFPILATADAIAPGMMLGYVFGRMGCQLAGDGDWGITANMALKPDWWPTWLWAQTYAHNVMAQTIPPPGVYPTPIYESAAALVLFAVIWKLRKLPFAPGFVFSLYLLLSGTERLLIEQIRVNERYLVAGLAFTQAELISGLFILAGACGLVRSLRQARPRVSF